MAPRLWELFHQPMKRQRRWRGVQRFMVELQQGPPGAWKSPLRDHRRMRTPYGLCMAARAAPMPIEAIPEATSRAEMTRLVFLPSMKKPRTRPPKP